MNDRKWHVEHADGSRWTLDELSSIVRRDWCYGRPGPGPDYWFTAISDLSAPFLVDTCGGIHGMPNVDALVVWDG